MLSALWELFTGRSGNIQPDSLLKRPAAPLQPWMRTYGNPPLTSEESRKLLAEAQLGDDLQGIRSWPQNPIEKLAEMLSPQDINYPRQGEQGFSFRLARSPFAPSLGSTVSATWTPPWRRPLSNQMVLPRADGQPWMGSISPPPATYVRNRTLPLANGAVAQPLQETAFLNTIEPQERARFAGINAAAERQDAQDALRHDAVMRALENEGQIRRANAAGPWRSQGIDRSQMTPLQLENLETGETSLGDVRHQQNLDYLASQPAMVRSLAAAGDRDAGRIQHAGIMANRAKAATAEQQSYTDWLASAMSPEAAARKAKADENLRVRQYGQERYTGNPEMESRNQEWMADNRDRERQRLAEVNAMAGDRARLKGWTDAYGPQGAALAQFAAGGGAGMSGDGTINPVSAFMAGLPMQAVNMHNATVIEKQKIAGESQRADAANQTHLTTAQIAANTATGGQQLSATVAREGMAQSAAQHGETTQIARSEMEMKAEQFGDTMKLSRSEIEQRAQTAAAANKIAQANVEIAGRNATTEKKRYNEDRASRERMHGDTMKLSRSEIEQRAQTATAANKIAQANVEIAGRNATTEEQRAKTEADRYNDPALKQEREARGKLLTAQAEDESAKAELTREAMTPAGRLASDRERKMNEKRTAGEDVDLSEIQRLYPVGTEILESTSQASKSADEYMTRINRIPGLSDEERARAIAHGQAKYKEGMKAYLSQPDPNAGDINRDRGGTVAAPQMKFSFNLNQFVPRRFVNGKPIAGASPKRPMGKTFDKIHSSFPEGLSPQDEKSLRERVSQEYTPQEIVDFDRRTKRIAGSLPQETKDRINRQRRWSGLPPAQEYTAEDITMG